MIPPKATNCIGLIALLAILPLLAVGQSEEVRQFGSFTAGVKLGLCTSQIAGDNYGGYNKVGPTGGVLIFTPLGDKTDIQMEINYCNRGSRDPADPDKGKLDSYRINLHYIDIPLLVKFKTWKFQFETGLTNGIFISSTEEDEFGTVTNSIFDFNTYELAFNLGANLPLTKNWIFNARYHRSIIPIANQRVLVPWFGFLGGSYNDALSFTIIRYLRSPE